MNNLVETTIPAEVESTPINQPSKAFAYPKLIGEKYHPGVGTPPQDGLTMAIPWKDPALVSQY